MSQTDRSFLWGTATAAYQIEGAWNKDGKGKNIWDVFSQTEGKIKNNDNGNDACDHYHRYQEDIDLIKNLDVDAYRLSISWSRLIPEGTGSLNHKGVEFYHRLFDALLEKNITPWATLYHWDLPQALQEKGGWVNRDIVGWFSDYSEKVAELYSDKIKNFIILNEPSITSYLGHFLGVFAPGVKNLEAMYASTHHQNLVNGTVTRLYKSLIKDANLGSSYTYFPVYPKDANKPEDVAAAKTIDRIWTRNYTDPLFLGQYPDDTKPHIEKFIQPNDMGIINTPQDYMGINHYSPNYAVHDENNAIKASMCDGPPGARTDIGWSISPDDLKKSLLEIKQLYNDPIVYVTENGMCENTAPDDSGEINDVRRIQYLTDYIAAVFSAIKEGCNVRGYFLWSAMDNFEWAEGYEKRFGIIHIDYKTLKRTPKKSYEWFKNHIHKSRKN